jgi:hypothetical protein
LRQALRVHNILIIYDRRVMATLPWQENRQEFLFKTPRRRR